MKEKIKDFIGDIVEIGTPIEYDTPLYSSEIINSMRHTQLINFLENEFSIVIPIKAISMKNSY